jgi:hypothetical protein
MPSATALLYAKLRMYGTLHLHSSIAIAMLAASNAEASRVFFSIFSKRFKKTSLIFLLYPEEDALVPSVMGSRGRKDRHNARIGRAYGDGRARGRAHHTVQGALLL